MLDGWSIRKVVTWNCAWTPRSHRVDGRRTRRADGFAMNKSMQMVMRGGMLCVCVFAASSTMAAERITFKKTCDPRPDILPHPIYDAHTEYRRAHNRPRYLTGWLASKIAPSSQEAMVWHENVCKGRYETHHAPPVYKRYFYPKPWEVLATGARPDTRNVPSRNAANFSSQPEPEVSESNPIPLVDGPNVPAPIPTGE